MQISNIAFLTYSDLVTNARKACAEYLAAKGSAHASNKFFSESARRKDANNRFVEQRYGCRTKKAGPISGTRF